MRAANRDPRFQRALFLRLLVRAASYAPLRNRVAENVERLGFTHVGANFAQMFRFLEGGRGRGGEWRNVRFLSDCGNVRFYRRISKFSQIDVDRQCLRLRAVLLFRHAQSAVGSPANWRKYDESAKRTELPQITKRHPYIHGLSSRNKNVADEV